LFKKMLFTLSVLTLLMAGAANAGDTTWNFYGVAHSSLNMLNNGETSQLGLSSNTSRFGFKGSAPMNEDLTAFWQFESKVDFAGSTANTSIGDRNTFVGMKHKTAGKIVFGRHDTPFKTLGRKVEFFADQLGDARTLTNRGPLASMPIFDGEVEGVDVGWDMPETSWDNRLGELVAWISPDFNGFNLFLAYQFDQGNKLNTTGDNYDGVNAFSGSATYAKDELMFGAAIEMLGNDTRASYIDRGTALFGDKASAMRFVGKYSTETVEFAGLYQIAQGQAYAYIDDLEEFSDVKATTMGVAAKFHAAPNWAIKGAYFMQDEFTDFDEDGLKPSLMALGIDRTFSENVMIYAQWASVSNDIISDVTIGGANGFGSSVDGYGAQPGDENMYQNPSGFSVGTVVTW